MNSNNIRSATIRRELQRARLAKKPGVLEYFSVIKINGVFFGVYIFPLTPTDIDFALNVLAKIVKKREMAELLLRVYYRELFPHILACDFEMLQNKAVTYSRLLSRGEENGTQN